MNYIRKKIKGHKKNHDDDDDFDFDTPAASSSDDPNAKPNLEKDSEEWKFFQQLTQRCQDTVQQTQTNLNKLKDSSAVEEISKPDYDFADLSSPSGPIAQPASSSWVSFKEGQGSNFETIPDPQKPKPPRPPPAKAQIKDESVLPINDIGSAPDKINANCALSLLEEFGFEKEPEPSIIQNIPASGLFILDDEEEPIDEDDPFDTTFADETLTNIGVTSKFQSPIEDFLGAANSTNFNGLDLLGAEKPINLGEFDLLVAKPINLNETGLLAANPINLNETGLLVAKPIDLDELGDIEDSGPDPFDTSFVNELSTERIAQSIASPPKEEIDFFSAFDDNKTVEAEQNIVASLKTSPDNNNEDMSNPFLPQEPSGSSAPPYGTRSRRMSTNPFEEDEADQPTDLLGDDFMGLTFTNDTTKVDNNIFEQIQNINKQDSPTGIEECKVSNIVQGDTNNLAFDLLRETGSSSKPVNDDPFDPFGSVSESPHAVSSPPMLPPTITDRKPNNVIEDESIDPFGFSETSVLAPQVKPMEDLFGLSDDRSFMQISPKSPERDIKKNEDSFWMPEDDIETEETVAPLPNKPASAVKDVINSLEKIASFAADDDNEILDTDFVSMLSKRGSSDLSATSLNQGMTEDDDTFDMAPKATDREDIKDFSPKMENKSPSKELGGNNLFDNFSTGNIDPFPINTTSMESSSSPFSMETSDHFLMKASEQSKMDTNDPFSTATMEMEKPASTEAWSFNPFGKKSTGTTEPNHQTDMDDFMMSDMKPTSGLENKTSHDTNTFFESTNAPMSMGNFMESDPFETLGASAVLSDAKSSDPFSFEAVKDSIPITDTAAFEAFAAKFEQAIEKDEASNIPETDLFDPFGGGAIKELKPVADKIGFGVVDMFDPFLSMTKPPENTPTKMPAKELSQDSFDDDDVVDFTVVIRPKMLDKSEAPKVSLQPPPLLPPPPKSPIRDPNQQISISRFNPFNKDFGFPTEVAKEKPIVAEMILQSEKEPPPGLGEAGVKKSDSAESPTTPLFDDDTSMPLEEFPPKIEVDGWEMMLRQPNKKKITGSRFWKKVYIRLSENSILQLYNKKEDNDPFQELPLQACYSLSEVGSQQYDAYGKIFTVKLNYIFYRERVGVRPGQISKVMQGQITSMGQFAKLGLPLEHAPQVSQLQKIGTQDYDDLKTFVQVMENALFHLTVHRDRALTYKTEEVQITVHDELYVEQKRDGTISKQNARVRLFFVAFISGMPDMEVGLNDLEREGKEVVGRYDIIPVVTEEWIRIENWEFHSCVCSDEFEKTRVVKLHPPDACYFELMRFRIRPPRNRELPLQVKCTMRITSMRVEMRIDILVTGYHSRKHGQVPCEDIQIRLPLPECWIYLFRTEKHFRYGSLKSAARKPGKIKGLERIMGAAQSLDPSLIEVSCGQAKYEHSFKSIVWRIPRLPKEGQGAYTSQLLLLKLELTSFDQIPETFEKYVYIEFTMPATTVSHTTVRSVSVTNETPPEKYVKYLAKQEYRIEIDMSTGDEECEYSSAIASAMNATNQSSIPESPNMSGSHNEEDDSD